jgi:hypothetical protein
MTEKVMTKPVKTATANPDGWVVSIRGLVVHVRIQGEKPPLRELLSLPDAPDVWLEISSYKDATTAICINLTN